MRRKIMPTVKPARWVKSDLFCALTGHTRVTIQKNKAAGIWKDGVHFKSGPEGIKTIYYNIEACDELLDDFSYDAQ